MNNENIPYNRYNYLKQRNLEKRLLEGPETVELIFDRKEAFYSNHNRMRDLKENSQRKYSQNEKNNTSTVMYWYKRDEKSGDVIYLD